MNTKRRRLTSALVVILTVAGTLTFASPNLMSYHGRLSDNAGDAVADGQYNVTFRIYDDPVGGAVLWAGLQSVTTLDGLHLESSRRKNPTQKADYS